VNLGWFTVLRCCKLKAHDPNLKFEPEKGEDVTPLDQWRRDICDENMDIKKMG
jgi:hypothetical protein